MRVMVIVKASRESEAGEMPTEKMLTDMGNYNEELVNAGVMQAGDGLHPSSKGKRVRFSGAEPDGHRRTVRRDQRAGRRILVVERQVDGRMRSTGSSARRSTAAPKSKSGRCSRQRISARR